MENIEVVDMVKKFRDRNENLLAELRSRNVAEICGLKDYHNGKSYGVAIGVSPNDVVLDKYSRGEITDIIHRLFKRSRTRGVTGALVPVAPLSVVLVGEYSPKHRWHYHGLINVENIIILYRIYIV